MNTEQLIEQIQALDKALQAYLADLPNEKNEKISTAGLSDALASLKATLESFSFTPGSIGRRTTTLRRNAMNTEQLIEQIQALDKALQAYLADLSNEKNEKTSNEGLSDVIAALKATTEAFAKPLQ